MIRFKDDEEIATLVENFKFPDRRKTSAVNFSKLLLEMVEQALDEAEEPQFTTEHPDEWLSAVKNVTEWFQAQLNAAKNPDDSTGNTPLIKPDSKLSYHGESGAPIKVAKINMNYAERLPASDYAINNLIPQLGKWQLGDVVQPTGETKKGGFRLYSKHDFVKPGRKPVPAYIDILFKSGGGGKANYATMFEGNIAYGLAMASAEQGGEIDEQYAESLHDKLKSRKGHMDDNPSAMKAGKAIGGVLLPQIEKALGGEKFTGVGKQSGADDAKGKDGAGKGQPETDDDTAKVKKKRAKSGGLTEMYKKHKVKSSESKADLVFNNSIGVSLKKAGGSQYAAAQAPETAALFEVAYTQIGAGREELEAEIDNMGKFILETMGRPSVGKAYDYRDNALHVAQADPAQAAGAEIEGYQKSLTKIMGMSMESQEARLDLTKEDKQGFVNAVTAQSKDSAAKLNNIVLEIVASDDFRKAVFREAVTGEYKFVDDKDKAKAMLVWDFENPEASTYGNLDAAWFDTHYAGQVKFGIRDRGGRKAGKGGRGMALRIEPVEPKDAEGKSAPKEKKDSAGPEQEQETMKEWYLNEKYFVFSEQGILSESIISDEVLEEGVKEALKWAGTAWTKGVKWAKEQIAALAQVVRTAVSNFVEYLKNILQEGFAKFLDFMGFELGPSQWEF